MEEFAALIDALVYTRSRNEKLRLIAEYLHAAPDPDRGWALAALTDGLDFPAVKSSTIRTILMERVDPVLWTLSRDFVGDTAETASLLWPAPDDPPDPPSVSETVDLLSAMTRKSVLGELPALLDRLDASGRYALLKLATGAMRIGISSRLAKVAFAQAFEVTVEEVEEHWHGLTPPYEPLFGWAAHGEAPPDTANMPTFRPFMLAHPLDETVVDLADYVAEWKWDGIRVQLVRMGGETRLYSRAGDDISGTFPELLEVLPMHAVLDGELLVRGSHQGGPENAKTQGGAASFNALQQRLGRKTVSKKMLADYPAFVRLYDVLIVEGEDLRERPWAERRARLEALMPRLPDSHFDLSQVVEAIDFEHLGADSRRRARRCDRGADAQAPRFALCRRAQDGAVVQVEARSAADRLRADVCPARQRQAIELLFRLHLRLLGRRPGRGGRAAAGRQGLLRVHRRRTQEDRPPRAHPHRQPFRTGARDRPQPGVRSGVRFGARKQAPQVGPGDALPAYPPDSLGQAGARGRPDRFAQGAHQGLIRFAAQGMGCVAQPKRIPAMTLADQIKPVADNALGTLDHLLGKAADHGGDALLGERLAPDMLPLAAQVRIACDQISAALKRVTDSTFSLPDEDDSSLAAARERVAKVRAALAGQADDSFAAADHTVELALPNGMNFAMRADEYLRDWTLPQLFFHLTTAYAILRAKGVGIGKADFLPYMMKHLKQPAPAA